MRVYLPATSATLQGLLETSSLGAPLTGFAVTPGLREWYHDDDIEELEYAAMMEAARASLRLLDADPESQPRRIVLAVDIVEADVEVRDDLDRGVVRVTKPVALARIASIHADDASSRDVILRAAESVNAADLGDAAAQDRVDDAEGFELSWYANQEIAALLDSF